MKHYSVDLRERQLSASDAGLSQAEASRIFGVGTSTTSQWVTRRATTGDVPPRPRTGRPATIGPDHIASLRAQVAAHPDATLAEHCTHWEREHDPRVSVATLSRAIRRLGITLKKRPDGH
jgi:transposase